MAVVERGTKMLKTTVLNVSDVIFYERRTTDRLLDLLSLRCHRKRISGKINRVAASLAGEMQWIDS